MKKLISNSGLRSPSVLASDIDWYDIKWDSPMTISLSSEQEKLIREKVRSGEFANPEAVIEFALSRLAARAEPSLGVDERVRAIDEFFSELDRDPPSGAPPFTTEALSRRSLYDDRRNRA